VSNKQANVEAGGQAPKRRRNNADFNTTRGATGFDALHGAAHNTAAQEKLRKGHQKDKETINKILTLVQERKQDCTEA
jgi:23S rRNA maturation mini-RNase III